VDDGIRRAYLKLADDYELLANNEDRVASHLKITHRGRRACSSLLNEDGLEGKVDYQHCDRDA